jgi:heme o synthase
LFFRLSKVTVALPVSFLTFAGFVIFSHTMNIPTLIATSGVLLVVSGALILNQLIEKDKDKLMERTRFRPIVKGEINSMGALFISFFLAVTGIILLYYLKPLSGLLAIINLVWYLGVYTLLKKVTPFAVIPGALIGGITVLIGWTAAGGTITDYRIVLVSLFVLMWQIPHFWLLMLIYGKEYEKAGFPTIFRIFNAHLLQLWTLGWIVAACIVSLFFPLFQIVTGKTIFYSIMGLQTVVIVYSVITLLKQNDTLRLKVLFHLVNMFLFLVMVLLVIESLMN